MTFDDTPVREISGSHGDEYEDVCLQGYCATTQKAAIFKVAVR
jgi:hypothetical protein